MGEAKNRRQNKTTHELALEALSRKLADDGRLVESGWVALRAMAIPPDAPDVQISEMRMAFMAGAQHLFASIMSVIGEDAEPTEADLKRLDLINAELEAFVRELDGRITTERPTRSH